MAAETIDALLEDARERMTKSLESTQHEFGSVRTGRASPALLERIVVDYYGAQTPLNQMATISAPEARLITVQPYDKSSIKNIEKAINESDVGLNPSNDGKPSTPTVLGRFRVYSKAPGTNSEGMVDSNYFIRGYAIHGYAEVPAYAASHGCLRIPIPNAASVFAWVQFGYPVDVYTENGRGSRVVRADAGP